MKDYYTTLGVSEKASPDEIKKAYRRLAKQYHPDATGGDVKKESRFKEVGEAYGVLSDAAKRTQYDQLRQNPYAQGAQWGGDTGVDISEIFAQFFGGAARGGGPGTRGNGGPRVSFHVGSFDAGDAGDAGGAGDPGGMFSDLFGGRRPRARRRSPRRVAVLELDLREAALGTVKSISVDGKNLQVRIPPGVDTGARLRAGDLSLEIAVRPHPTLRREGADLHSDLTLSVDEAILGARIEVPTLEGQVALTIPPGTSSGATLRLRGKGAAREGGGRGDQYVHVRIAVPREVPQKARALIEEFARLTGFRPRG